MGKYDSRVELNVMLEAVMRDAGTYFRMGRFRAKKKLSNGATVTVEIRMPDSTAKPT